MRPKLFSAVSLVITAVLVAGLPARAADDLALARTVAEANNAFGVALYREFAKAPGNLVFSPFSLSSALALTATGARGQTEKELWQALRLNLPRERVAAGYAWIAAEFAKSTRDEMASLTVANSLWPQKGYALKSEFLDVAHRQFAAEVTPLDYAKPDAASEQINGWISKKTSGLIQQVISPGALTPQTRLTLCNAVHFKARWSNEFNKRKTSLSPFYLMNWTPVEVPTMKRTGWYSTGESSDCSLLSLSYTGGGFEMVIVLPKGPATLAAVEQSMDAARVQRWMKALDVSTPSYLEFEVPRFKTRAEPDCVHGLSFLGVKDAFSLGKVDFSGMSPERGLTVGTVLHKAVIDVNEEGTEAAAVTALVMFGAMADQPPIPKPFKIDHPFLFFIRETRTGAILFMGRIVDPRAE